MKTATSSLLREVMAAGLLKALDLDPHAVEAARRRALAISEKMRDRIQSEHDGSNGGTSNDRD